MKEKIEEKTEDREQLEQEVAELKENLEILRQALDPSLMVVKPSPVLDPKELMIMVEVKVDDYNIVRKRVAFRPSMCDECGRDMMKEGGDKNPYYNRKWEDLREEQRDDLRQMVVEHKSVYHIKSNQRIVQRGELPTFWNGVPINNNR